MGIGAKVLSLTHTEKGLPQDAYQTLANAQTGEKESSSLKYRRRSYR